MAADDSRTADAVAALFAPDPAVAAHSAVRAVRRIARDVLAPHAPAADDPARGVDPAHLALLAEAGQLAVTVPVGEGGLGGDGRVGIEAMGGTRTVPLTTDGFEVRPDDVLAVVDGPAWRVADDARTANAMPAAVGLLRRVVVALAALGEERGSNEAVHTALYLASHGAALRARAYGLLLEVPAGERTTERTALRGELAALTVRAAHALIAARSGSALLADSPEQRWAREAAFHLVQAQTAAVRAAQLTAFRRAQRGRPAGRVHPLSRVQIDPSATSPRLHQPPRHSHRPAPDRDRSERDGSAPGAASASRSHRGPGTVEPCTPTWWPRRYPNCRCGRPRTGSTRGP